MKNQKKLMALIVLSITILYSCKKPADGATGPAGPQGVSGPSYIGNLEGHVNHYDVSGQKILTGLNGDTVYMDGTTNFAITDINGLYTFSSIATGNYNLTVSRAGFGKTKLQNIQFIGVGDTYKDLKISKLPSINITTINAIDTVKSGNHYLKIKGTIPPNPSGSTIIVYISLPGNSSVSSNTNNYSNYFTINVAANATSFSSQTNVSDFYDLGFITGNTVYLACYVISGNLTASSYQDFSNDRTVFTALSSTPVFNSYILP